MLSGKTWFGPVNVPDKQLGWVEELKEDKAGIWYTNKVEGTMPGIDANAHANLGNLMYKQVCIVGKLRAGGHYIILGNKEDGLKPWHSTSSGQGAADTSVNKLQFTNESIYKSLMLPSFSPVATPPPGTNSSANENYVMAEIIYFTNQTSVTVPYTGTRRLKYGDLPEIEVWFVLVEGGETKYVKANVEITMDASPPNQTSFTVNNGGAATGYIRLGR